MHIRRYINIICEFYAIIHIATEYSDAPFVD